MGPWPPIFRGWETNEIDVAVDWIEEILWELNADDLAVSVIRVLSRYFDAVAEPSVGDAPNRRHMKYIIAAIWLCGKFYIEEEWAPSDMELISLTEYTQSGIRQAEKDILQTLGTKFVPLRV